MPRCGSLRHEAEHLELAQRLAHGALAGPVFPGDVHLDEAVAPARNSPSQDGADDPVADVMGAAPGEASSSQQGIRARVPIHSCVSADRGRRSCPRAGIDAARRRRPGTRPIFDRSPLPNRSTALALALAPAPALPSAAPPTSAARPLRILFLASAHNSLSQRALVALTELGHGVSVAVVDSGAAIEAAVARHRPELIVCPMLKTIIPERSARGIAAWSCTPARRATAGPSSLDWAIELGAAEWGVTVLEADGEVDGGDVWAARTFPHARGGQEQPLPPRGAARRDRRRGRGGHRRRGGGAAPRAARLRATRASTAARAR